MTPPTAVPVATVEQLRGRLRRKSQLKGRQPDHEAVEQVRALIGRPWEERQDAGQVVWRYYVRYESRQLLELLGVIPVKETPAYGALEAKITFDRGVVRATVVK